MTGAASEGRALTRHPHTVALAVGVLFALAIPFIAGMAWFELGWRSIIPADLAGSPDFGILIYALAGLLASVLVGGRLGIAVVVAGYLALLGAEAAASSAEPIDWWVWDALADGAAYLAGYLVGRLIHRVAASW